MGKWIDAMMVYLFGKLLVQPTQVSDCVEGIIDLLTGAGYVVAGFTRTQWRRFVTCLCWAFWIEVVLLAVFVATAWYSKTFASNILIIMGLIPMCFMLVAEIVIPEKLTGVKRAVRLAAYIPLVIFFIATCFLFFKEVSWQMSSLFFAVLFLYLSYTIVTNTLGDEAAKVFMGVGILLACLLVASNYIDSSPTIKRLWDASGGATKIAVKQYAVEIESSSVVSADQVNLNEEYPAFVVSGDVRRFTSDMKDAGWFKKGKYRIKNKSVVINISSGKIIAKMLIDYNTLAPSGYIAIGDMTKEDAEEQQKEKYRW